MRNIGKRLLVVTVTASMLISGWSYGVFAQEGSAQVADPSVAFISEGGGGIRGPFS